jgi:exopolysaccharide biosynthesis WecB/TagA/CpsF family protein
VTGTRTILSQEVFALSQGEAVRMLEDRIKSNIPTQLAFLNANLANMALEDKQLQRLLRNFVLFNDGSGLNIASRLLHGKPFPANLNGTDFVPYFFDKCRPQLRIFLLGGSNEVNELAAKTISRRWPKHVVCGFHNGYFQDMHADRVIGQIRKCDPNLVLVAMGNGPQELWCQRLGNEGVLSAWGVGGLLDFLSGHRSRAPLAMRKLGMEWVYCLACEPRRRWKRYLIGNPKFIFYLLREKIMSVFFTKNP